MVYLNTQDQQRLVDSVKRDLNQGTLSPKQAKNICSKVELEISGYIPDSDANEYLSDVYESLKAVMEIKGLLTLAAPQGKGQVLVDAMIALAKVEGAVKFHMERELENRLDFATSEDERRKLHEDFGFGYDKDHPAYSLIRGQL